MLPFRRSKLVDMHPIILSKVERLLRSKLKKRREKQRFNHTIVLEGKRCSTGEEFQSLVDPIRFLSKRRYVLPNGIPRHPFYRTSKPSVGFFFWGSDPFFFSHVGGRRVGHTCKHVPLPEGTRALPRKLLERITRIY